MSQTTPPAPPIIGDVLRVEERTYHLQGHVAALHDDGVHQLLVGWFQETDQTFLATPDWWERQQRRGERVALGSEEPGALLLTDARFLIPHLIRLRRQPDGVAFDLKRMPYPAPLRLAPFVPWSADEDATDDEENALTEAVIRANAISHINRRLHDERLTLGALLRLSHWLDLRFLEMGPAARAPGQAPAVDLTDETCTPDAS